MLNQSPLPLDRVFGALADPTRRTMLERLARGECSVGELAKPHRMSLPAISQHLRVLESAGLVRRQRNGRFHRMRMQPGRLLQAQAWISAHRAAWEARLDRLNDFLNEMQSTKGNK